MPTAHKLMGTRSAACASDRLNLMSSERSLDVASFLFTKSGGVAKDVKRIIGRDHIAWKINMPAIYEYHSELVSDDGCRNASKDGADWAVEVEQEYL
jgi:hypothetical protein